MVNVSKIRELLKEHGWSASYLCRTFGKGSTWLADMERGRGLPDESAIKAIANKLDTTIDYLTDKTDKKNKPTKNSELDKMLQDPEMKDIYNIIVKLSPDGVQKVKDFAHFQREQETKQKP